MAEVSPFSRTNVVLHVEYDGTSFHGWQRQPGHPSIQATIEDVLQDILKRRVAVYGAGRTDSGVSARGQVANFWGDSRFEPHQWARVLNSRLPNSIRIVRSAVLDDSFHAQRKSIGKLYEYKVLHRNTRSALETRALFYPRALNWEKIQEALPYFLGTHDFASFQGPKSTVISTVREITRFELFKEQDGIYRFEIEGTGFLKQMVRTMIGTVLEVGEGRRKPTDIPLIIQARDRQAAGRTVTAIGLCLVKVKYPPDLSIKLGIVN